MKILGKPIGQWEEEFPIVRDLIDLKETLWINPKKLPIDEAVAESSVTMEDVLDASARLERFAPYLALAFPETAKTGGIIESPLAEIENMRPYLEGEAGGSIQGRLLLKLDSHLPISGSIKARGGIYEVLHHAEDIALQSGLLKLEDNYAVLMEPRFRELFSQYSIAVGSTGNLGLSIGIMSAKLGFKVTVHMSADARQWKKDLLRSKGVQVVEYADDYSKAVEEGRRQAQGDDHCHFVDDENSKTLFMGYSVAALRLKNQLAEAGIPVDETHPLFVYLPCGVGGGPGGVAFGIKQVFGGAAHCFFAEPTHSPCMILGLSTGYHDQVCVQDFGIDNRTAADGLAVGRASSFVGKVIQPFLSGSYTVTDERLYQYLAALTDQEGIRLEPSALAGMKGPGNVCATEGGKAYQSKEGITSAMAGATHLIWATGGNMVPEAEMSAYYQKGKSLLTN